MKDNTRGALLMIGSMTGFTLNDACMKSLSVEIPLFQAIFLRGIATTLAILLLARLTGRLSFSLPRRDRRVILLRTLVEIGAAYFFISALFNMPIANATAILQTLPLTVTLAGAVFLGEAVGWRRLSAIFIGFLGVVLIVRPGTEGFNIYSIYALIAVALVTARDLLARALSPEVPSLTVAAAAAFGVMLLGAGGTVGADWVPMEARHWGLIGGSVLFVVAGYVFSVAVMRVGDIGFVAPFRYTSLLIALIVGVLVFGEWPAPLTLFGAAIVVGMGIWVLYREQVVQRAGRAG
ncbi:EamA-like transporter family protein [Pseudoruegeria aquimaris]|uniref:EamA-like transporter family protein n=1 Tax=Pseudoruegeria aquimaris TaxID=393663 RepID=A0A1Y5TMR3_9RHOB|nr:DMT family transporter [Pseudoruegeria aquimaris]SLN65839.1 EamA-like transporter family protein [Pseudoruegeria aquimaris]